MAIPKKKCEAFGNGSIIVGDKAFKLNDSTMALYESDPIVVAMLQRYHGVKKAAGQPAIKADPDYVYTFQFKIQPNVKVTDEEAEAPTGSIF